MTALGNPDERWLDRLVGAWDQVGTVASRDVHRSVVGRWVLGGLFVAIDISDVCPPRKDPYAAIYYVGYATRDDLFVLHMLDRAGATAEAVIGFGERNGVATTFVFASPRGSWTFRMTWSEPDDTWTFVHSTLEAEGPRLVARTVMRRSPAS